MSEYNQEITQSQKTDPIVESELGCTSRVYFDHVTLKSHNVTLTSQKPCQYNNTFDCSKTNGYSIPQDTINEVNLFCCQSNGFEYSCAHILQNSFSLRQFRLTKYRYFIHSTPPYIHSRLDSRMVYNSLN